jgi:hypothetical protein
MKTAHFEIQVRPMQSHIGGSTDHVYFTKDKAINKFFELCDEHGLEPLRYSHNNIDTYSAGGVGHDYRITLEVVGNLN